MSQVTRRRWRNYKTEAGRCPVSDFLDSLSDHDAAEIVAAMNLVARDGLVAARHLRGDIYEVRVDGLSSAYRVLFSAEGRRHSVLLALEAFSKKSQKTPPRFIELAQRRLDDWHQRAKR